MWRIDRLGRSLLDALDMVGTPRRREVQVLSLSLSGGIDPSTSTGPLMLNMLATLADYERELIAERVQAGVDAARQRRPPREAVAGAGDDRREGGDRCGRVRSWEIRG